MLVEIALQSLAVQICEGESFTIDGMQYDTTGRYTHTTTNVYGCDSLILLDVLVLEAKKDAEYIAICEGEPFLFKGELIEESGVYKDTITSVDSGCDSIFTLVIDVFPTEFTNLEVFMCEGDTYEYNGVVYDKTGEYTQRFQTEHGCDSIVELTIDLLQPPINTLIKEICEGETFRVGEKDFTDEGSFTEVSTASNGCDSIINLELIVHPNF